MSYRKDEHPPRIMTCRKCREKFETHYGYGDLCRSCYAELNDEWPDDENQPHNPRNDEEI